MTYGSRLQEHRAPRIYTCELCGLKIRGKRNTVHLAILSHHRKHIRSSGERVCEALKKSNRDFYHSHNKRWPWDVPGHWEKEK